MNIFCKIGLHYWVVSRSDVVTKRKVIYRTYDRCKRCGLYGQLVSL